MKSILFVVALLGMLVNGGVVFATNSPTLAIEVKDLLGSRYKVLVELENIDFLNPTSCHIKIRNRAYIVRIVRNADLYYLETSQKDLRLQGIRVNEIETAVQFSSEIVKYGNVAYILSLKSSVPDDVDITAKLYSTSREAGKELYNYLPLECGKLY